ncbi:MAG: threonine synthase [Gammaproteobacteria bacterium]|nr:threonine synthase [Gammaproteobacteria bacterium]
METRRYTGLIDRYREFLPIAQDTPAVTLCEGDTPLIELKRLPREWGTDCRVLAKFEGLNPTGSFKDRGMTVAVTRAAEEGSRAIICASTGNTSASAAAYATRAGMECFVLIPEGNVALGKLAQAIMHGATILQIKGNFDDGMRLVREVGEEMPVSIVNSINPYRLQGQKTIAYEVVGALGTPPDYHCLPVGNAGNISAHWIGYSELAGCRSEVTETCESSLDSHNVEVPKQVDKRPVMVGYQASGSAPFMRGEWVEKPETRATAIRIGHPQSWDYAWIVHRESGGWFDECTDEEILEMQRQLASNEGVFCEPASAVSVAGVMRDILSGKIENGSTVVCTLTGHGLKDPSVVEDVKLESVEPTLENIKDIIGNKLGI